MGRLLFSSSSKTKTTIPFSKPEVIFLDHKIWLFFIGMIFCLWFSTCRKKVDKKEYRKMVEEKSLMKIHWKGNKNNKIT